MPTPLSHVKKRAAKRTYRGHEEALYLLDLLNEGRMMRIDPDPLREIILALQSLGDIRPIRRQRVLSGDPRQAEDLRKVEAVNKLLGRYEARPRLRPPSPFGGNVRLEWRCAGKDAELNAVLIAVELARTGRITSLKECANPGCTRWLFAQFPHKRFCSDDCYKQFHQAAPKDKERRRAWAKENYRSRKELELGSRKAAQRKGGKR